MHAPRSVQRVDVATLVLLHGHLGADPLEKVRIQLGKGERVAVGLAPARAGSGGIEPQPQRTCGGWPAQRPQAC